MQLFYMLDEDKNTIPCTCAEWSNYFETVDRKVAFDVIDDHEVSTVFLGIYHNYFGAPLVFETMIFYKGDSDSYCKRYATWDEAIKGHRDAIEYLKCWKDPADLL